MKVVRDIVFDLDGTLIDSAPSILASMQAAFEKTGIEPLMPLTSALIGPPLAQTVLFLLPPDRTHAMQDVVQGFKSHYDVVGYQQSRVYPGVHDMLQALGGRPVRLHIATNKRITPTHRILEHLGWKALFISVNALNSSSPALPHKTAMLQRLRHDLADDAPLYVGDRSEDAEAAQASGMPFLWASRGYGGPEVSVPANRVLHSPLQLVDAL